MKKRNWSSLGLTYNPFEPAASGAPIKAKLWIPKRWKDQINSLFDIVETGQGVKAITIEGEYGSGKTYLMRWLEQESFPARRIRPFFFDNPGVQFYDLANNLLRQIGRYEFSKSLWEYIKPTGIGPVQPGFFDSKDVFVEWLTQIKRRKGQSTAKSAIAKSLQETKITDDEEIAYRLAMIIVETLDKPYFEYRDFVAGKNALVAENEEANYFSAIIRALTLTSNVNGVSFLLDEFEEISYQKRLNRKEALDYLGTLKRLLNVAREQDFWLILSMTPQAADISRQLEPALWQRFTGRGKYQFKIPELDEAEAEELLSKRLEDAYVKDKQLKRLWPFSENIIRSLTPVTYSSPRRLVKVAFYILTEALEHKAKPPINEEFIQDIEAKVYPPENQ